MARSRVNLTASCTARRNLRGQKLSLYWRASCEGEPVMDFAKLTQMSREAVAEAQNIARRHSNNEVETWHLLSALLAQENGIVPGLLNKMNIAPTALQGAVEREIERLPRVSGSVDTSKVYVTQAVNEVLTK